MAMQVNWSWGGALWCCVTLVVSMWNVLHHLKAGFHMIATIAKNAAIAGKKTLQQSLQSCGNHLLGIVAITATIWKPAYMENAQRSKSHRPLNFFGSDRSDHMEISLYWTDRCSTGLCLNAASNFTIYNIFQVRRERNFFLLCSWRAQWIVFLSTP